VRRLVFLGFDVNARSRTTALHEAAWKGDLDTVEFLVSLGADPAITDEEHHSTPAGWADHNGHDEVAAWLTARVGLPLCAPHFQERPRNLANPARLGDIPVPPAAEGVHQ
jgi:ankyrin repeat protein